MLRRFFEDEPLLIFNFECLQKCLVFIDESSLSMVFLLILNITYNVGHSAFGIREGAVTFLPCKRRSCEVIVIDPFCAFYRLGSCPHEPLPIRSNFLLCSSYRLGSCPHEPLPIRSNFLLCSSYPLCSCPHEPLPIRSNFLIYSSYRLCSCPHEPLPIRSNFLLCSSQMATFVFRYRNTLRLMDKTTFGYKRKSFIETGEIYFWTATISNNYSVYLPPSGASLSLCALACA